jgi:hypothetical protein
MAMVLLLTLSVAPSCARTLASFDPVALQNATSLKDEALALMDQAGAPWATHEAAVNALMARVDAAWQHASNTPRNSGVASLWNEVRDPAGSLLPAFFGLWQRSGTLRAGDIVALKSNVSRAFDQIIQAEEAKRGTDDG